MPTRKQPPPNEQGFRVVADEDMPSDDDYPGEPDEGYEPEEGDIEEVINDHPAGKRNPPKPKNNGVGDAVLPTIEVLSTFGRTRQMEQFEPAKAEVTIREVFPGTMTPNEVADVVKSQFQQIKSQVYLELGLPFEQDDATGRLMEAFPGSTVVASRPAPNPPAAARSAQRSAPARSQPAPRQAPARQASRGPQSRATGNRQQGGLTTAELWQELCDYPGYWNDLRSEKRPGDRGPDFRSTRHRSGQYFVGLWLDSKEAPDESELPEDGFANYE